MKHGGTSLPSTYSETEPKGAILVRDKQKKAIVWKMQQTYLCVLPKIVYNHVSFSVMVLFDHTRELK